MTQQEASRWRDYGQMVDASRFCERCKRGERIFAYGREKYKDGKLQFLSVFSCCNCGWKQYIYTDVVKNEREQMKVVFTKLDEHDRAYDEMQSVSEEQGFWNAALNGW